MSRQLQIGEKIGDYEIIGFLGAGGMGQVFHGVHTKLGRGAAIKILSTTADNSTFTERFFNEARLQSSLHHPNIATLYDFKEIDGQLIIFMEYADGECLDDMIKRRAFTVEDALRTFEAVCDAVAFIHGNGIVHRDIKAQNIKLTTGKKVKLLDFGIAKDDASLKLTRADGVIGTPTYLAPEQLAGKGAGPHTDIWALGVLLYEMLTGSAPFKGDTLGDLLSHITSGSFEPPEKLNAAVTPAVSHIVERCLKQNPDERYRSVEDILVDIRAQLGGKKRGSLFGFRSSPPSPERPPEHFAQAAAAAAASPSSEPSVPAAGSAKRSGGPSVVLIAVAALGVIFLFVGVVAVAIWASSGSSNAIASNTTNQKPQGNGNSRVAVQSSNSNGPRVEGLPASTSAGEPIKVTLETSEGPAGVYRGDQLIGKTPFEVEGKEGESIELILKREGYQDEVVRFDIMSRKRVYTFSLKRKKANI